MIFRTSLTQHLDNPRLTPSERAELRCRLARELEEAGDYGGAREALGTLWRGVGVRPALDGLEGFAASEVLLRAGVLTGWLGHADQVKDSQEAAKNLISEAARRFGSLGAPQKVQEAQIELAYCYWREGAFDEARVILDEVLEGLPGDGELKAKAVVRRVIVERGAYREALSILNRHAPLFEKITNHTILGGYHNELAIALRNVGTSENREDFVDRAFVEYAAASYHFEQAGHDSYRARVENNLGFLHFKAGRYREAHGHLDVARRLLLGLHDAGSVAQVDETRARVFLAEGRHTEAERVARAAVATLEKGGRQWRLAEALTTHGTALARLGRADDSRLTLYRAIEVAHQSGALNDAGLAALAVLEELWASLTYEELHAVYERAHEWLTPSRHQETLHRLLRAANRLLTLGGREADEAEARALEGEAPETGTLREVMRRQEGRLIRRALQDARGSVTQAARTLGVSHQALIYMLEHRHKELLDDRRPVVKRRRVAAPKRKGDDEQPGGLA
ncbi:MAG TPA: helix-turn-helix domain-containing protein [Pyrinomonadaceae bacterium]|nr:helix-turn-helix domain-containing protein [Pyrinomonadaceae bacterium]